MNLIFDCDGVLVNSMHLHNIAESEAYAAVGIHIPVVDLERRFAGTLMSEAIAILESETGVKVPPDFTERLERKKIEAFSHKLKRVDGVSETLAELKSIPKAVASGSDIDFLNYTLKITDLFDVFAPHIYSAQQVGRGKPAPDLFLMAAEKIGAAPADCIVIEDATAGILAAKAAGMKSFGFIGAPDAHDDLRERLTAAGADLIFDRMIQLPELLKPFR